MALDKYKMPRHNEAGFEAPFQIQKGAKSDAKKCENVELQRISNENNEDLIENMNGNDLPNETDEVFSIKTNYKITEEEFKKLEKKFQPSPKLNTFVGFLRLANYVCASTVTFGVVISIFHSEKDPRLKLMNLYRNESVEDGLFHWEQVVDFATGWIQIAYLVVISVVVMIDSIATR